MIKLKWLKRMVLASACMVLVAFGSDSVTKEGQVLLRQFTISQSAELKSLEHRQKTELKELDSAQSVRKKEWMTKERQERRKFFESHDHGPDRREYVRDYLVRKKLFEALLKDERTKKIKDQEALHTTLKDTQKAKHDRFEDAVAKGQHPDDSLWPEAGH